MRDINVDAVACATLLFAMNTETANGQRGRGSFARPALKWLDDRGSDEARAADGG